MRLLVTGGAGYVGSHACKALARAGHELVVYDNLDRGHAEAVRWGPLEQGDIRDRARLSAVISRHRPDLVMHFAALAYVGESMERPLAYHDVNVGGTLSLLEAMREQGVGAIVFSSTCATYGIPEILPIREDAPQRPVNPYGFSKLAVERMLADCAAAHGLAWMALRYFNAAGADPDGEIGEVHEPETHAIPLALRAALGRGPAFSVLGRDLDTPDGTAIRDYIHVTDLADAHVRAAEHLAGGGESGALNLGTGRGTSVAELVEAVSRVSGRPVPTLEAPRRAGDPPILYAEAGRAAQLLGWRPTLSSLDRIIETALAWECRDGRGGA